MDGGVTLGFIWGNRANDTTTRELCHSTRDVVDELAYHLCAFEQ